MEPIVFDVEIPLEELADEDGANVFLNARLRAKSSWRVAVGLYDRAASFLEDELRTAASDSQERRAVLGMLDECYQKLCVESSYPAQLQTAVLQYRWPHYIKRSLAVHQELIQYN